MADKRTDDQKDQQRAENLKGHAHWTHEAWLNPQKNGGSK
jgi:hypothetical protein